MCYYARKSVTRKQEATYPNLMTATPEEKEPTKKKVYALAYAKTKAIMCKLFHARGKDEHAPAM